MSRSLFVGADGKVGVCDCLYMYRVRVVLRQALCVRLQSDKTAKNAAGKPGCRDAG